MQNPSEIAREALRQLSAQRIPPTPDNYRILYHRIAGTPDAGGDGFEPLAQLRPLVEQLPRRSDEERRQASEAQAALERRQWPQLMRLLAGALAARGRDGGERWDLLIQQFVQRWDATQAGLTRAQKRQALDRALKAPGTAPQLFARLNALLGQWATGAPGGDDGGDAPPPAGAPRADALRELAAAILETLVAPLLDDAPPLAAEAAEAAGRLRAAAAPEVEEIAATLRRLALRVEFHLDDRRELRGGLLHLLQLVIDNIGELVIDEQWLAGQVEMLRSILVEPLDVRAIDNAERRIKEVLYKQGQLKLGLADAQKSLKSLLAGFVDELTSFAESTGAYHDKLDACAQKIGRARNITELSGVIDEVMRETRAIQTTARTTRDDLEAVRTRVAEAERRVAELESELAQASRLVSHDALTGALNRRGLEEVFDKEIHRARRRDSPLSIAVIDVDDFKKLNDALGHQAGDAALVHLVRTIRELLRPQDTVARFGGEEFVVLLPDTALDEARNVLIRVQRELTRRFFLHENQKILITFSAGVTELPRDEDRDAAIGRADQLMYQAKTTGKNKVVAA